MEDLEWFINLGHETEPKSFAAHAEPNPGYWSSDEWDLYENNPPFESPKSIWYHLSGKGRGANSRYQLSEYANDGQVLKTAETNLLSKPSCHSKSWCACTVLNVSQEQNAILTFCRRQSVNFTGSFDWHEQWITVFTSKDLSQIGDAALTTRHIRAAIADVEGHTYVATVEEGKELRIYSVPGH